MRDGILHERRCSCTPGGQEHKRYKDGGWWAKTCVHIYIYTCQAWAKHEDMTCLHRHEHIRLHACLLNTFWAQGCQAAQNVVGIHLRVAATALMVG